MNISKFNKTIHDTKVYELIRKIIKSPKKFLKENQKRRFLISEKLKNLTLTLDYTEVYRESYTIKELETEYAKFLYIFQEQMSLKITRSDSGQIKNKIKIIIERIIKKLSAFNGLKEKTFEEVAPNINYEHLFYLLTSSFLSSRSNYDITGYEIKNNEVLASTFISKIKFLIVMLLSATTLKETPFISEGLSYIQEEFTLISNEDDHLDQLSHQILDIYFETLSLKSRILIYTYKESTKSARLIEIPDKILKNFVQDTHLPEIVKPEVKYESLEDNINFVKKVHNGHSTTQISTKTKKSLDISNSKKFMINEECIKIFEEVDKMSYDVVKEIDALPFTPLKVLEHKEQIVNNLKNTIDKSKVKLIKEKYLELIIEKIKVDDREKYILENNKDISEEEIKIAKKLYNARKDLKRLTRLRTVHNTMIELAKIFKGYPIYFINSIDYRLRMYPWNYPFNRTSGVHKYLIFDYENNKVRSNEINLMTKSLGIFKDLDEVDIIKKCGKSFIYKILLKRELNRLSKEKNPKTRLFLEIDQRSSSSTFASILLGDKQLSEEANIGTDKEGDPASKLMNSSLNFFKGITPESESVITTNRELHKYLLMCFIYNQERNGRKERCKEYIENIDDCNIISSKYPKLIDTVFGSLSKKRDKVNDIIRYFIDNSESNIITIDTLDESRLSWIIYRKLRSKFSKKKYLSPITNEYKSFDSKRIRLDEIQKNECVKSFLPGIIHSLDASIMRMIIQKVFENTGYTINHVHDCIHFSPYYYEPILKSIEEVYQESNIHLFLNDNIISNLRNGLILEKRKEFDSLLKELENSDFASIDLKNYKINVTNMYRLE